MIEARMMQGPIQGAYEKVLSWLAFLNGHRAGNSELKRHPALTAIEVESLRQIYVR